MKEIKYDDNLKDTINKLKNYNVTKAYIIKILSNLIGLAMACFFGFVIINNLAFWFCVLTSSATTVIIAVTTANALIDNVIFFVRFPFIFLPPKIKVFVC